MDIGTLANPRFASERAKPVQVRVIDIRVPRKGDYYINRYGKITACHGISIAKHGEKRMIISRVVEDSNGVAIVVPLIVR